MTNEATQILELNLAVAAPQQAVTVPAAQVSLTAGPLIGAGNAVAAAPSARPASVQSSQFMPDATGFLTGVGAPPSGADVQKRDKVIVALLGLIMLVAAGLWAFADEITTNSIMAMIGLGDAGEGEMPLAAPAPAVRKDKPALPAVAGKSQIQPSESVWETLANEMPQDLPKPERSLTPDELRAMSDSVAGGYTFQKFQVALQIGRLRASGGEDLLRQLLQEPKLWIRMRALMALADLGEEISEDEMKAAVGRERTDLYIGFFKRFERSEACSPGCYYAARGAMRYLSPRARSSVIQLIARDSTGISGRYVNAAQSEPAMSGYGPRH